MYSNKANDIRGSNYLFASIYVCGPDTALDITSNAYFVQPHAMASICRRNLYVRTRSIDHGI